MYSSGERTNSWADPTTLLCSKLRNLPDRSTLKPSWKTSRLEVLWAAWEALVASASTPILTTKKIKHDHEGHDHTKIVKPEDDEAEEEPKVENLDDAAAD